MNILNFHNLIIIQFKKHKYVCFNLQYPPLPIWFDTFFEKYSTKVWYKRKDILTLHSQTRNKHS